MVGMTGFEPAASSPPAKRATKLRHIPTCGGLGNLTRAILASHDLQSPHLLAKKKGSRAIKFSQTLN